MHSSITSSTKSQVTNVNCPFHSRHAEGGIAVWIWSRQGDFTQEHYLSHNLGDDLDGWKKARGQRKAGQSVPKKQHVIERTRG